MPEKWFKTSGYPPSRSRAGWGMMRRPKGSRRYGSVCILKMDPIASTYTDTESDKTLLRDFETLVFLSGVLMYRIIKQFDPAQSEVFQQLKSLKVTQKATPVFLVLMHLDCFFLSSFVGVQRMPWIILNTFLRSCFIWLQVLNFHQPSATWTSFEAELRELRSCEGMDVSPFSTARESQIVGRCFLWEVDGGM